MIAHFDCTSGVSGDMILGALVDAGADLDQIRKEIEKVGIADIDITARGVYKRGIRATQVEVAGRGAAAKAFSTYSDAEDLIDHAGLDPDVAAAAKDVLMNLCRAEAAVHGGDPASLHVHEVGAADTIVDVVGALVGMQLLQIDLVSASAVATGTGTIRSAHGLLPVPAPATLELLKGVPIQSSEISAELTTPTGAALLTHLSSSFGEIAPMVVSSIGYGAGSRDLEIPNVLRMTVGESTAEQAAAIPQLQTEANIDDMNPEFYEYVFERLFKAGALDVWITPCLGKKGRPANVLHILSNSSDEQAVREVVVAETSTIGIRTLPIRRWMLERERREVTVSGATIGVKVATHQGKIVNVAPEYADCVKAARESGIALKEIYFQAESAARNA